MKKTICIVIISLFTLPLVLGQNPLDTVTWPKVKWEKTPGISCEINLMNVLDHHINEARQDSNLKFLELHYSSVKMLLKEFPYYAEYRRLCKLMDTYRNYDDGGSLDKYRQGAKQLLLAYETTLGVISYVAVCLPENYDPRIAYPLYIWGTEGNLSIVDPDYKLDEQITGGLLFRAPSSRFKDGYSIIPYALRRYGSTDKSLADIMKAIDYFAENFKTDKSKYYMGGFSSGAAETFYLSTYSGVMEKYKFAGLAFYALAITPEKLSRDLSSLSDVPIWLSVGSQDYSNLTNISYSFNKKLTEIGNPPKFYYPYAIGHVWTQQIQEDMCFFLQKQQRPLPGEIPLAPTDLTESISSEDKVEILWTDNSDNELYFVVKRKSPEDEKFKEIAKVALNETFYIDKTVIQGNTYIYTVSAYNSSGISDTSNKVTVLVPGKKLENIARDKSITVSNESKPMNCLKLIDGYTIGIDRYRWNASPFPQWAEIDLGELYDISMFKLYPYDNREYLYSIEVKKGENDVYSKIVDKSFIVSSPVYTDEVTVTARFVRLTVKGALIYAGKDINITEFEVYGSRDSSTFIQNTSINNRYKIYPNPANCDIITLQSSGKMNAMVQLASLDGKLLKSFRLDGPQAHIDVTALQPGIYILHIIRGDGLLTRKIIIE